MQFLGLSQCLRNTLLFLAMLVQYVQSKEPIILLENIDNYVRGDFVGQRLQTRDNTNLQLVEIYKNHKMNRVLSRSTACFDNIDFVDYLGLSCTHHQRTYDCKRLQTIGYTLEKVQEVLANCPKSCKICLLEMDDAHSGTNHDTRIPLWSPTMMPTAVDLSASQGGCVDNPLYSDKVGFRCSDHSKTLDCKKVEMVGYSKKQVRELLRNCPLSCDVCRLWSPSTTPSDIPSKIPSENPSGFPSSIPSLIPSGVPSGIPSSVPTFLPSKLPSSPPTTKIPTSSPTDECHDNLDFRDYLGLDCIMHKKSICGQTGAISYPLISVWQLMINCPYSCGYCVTTAPSPSPSSFPSKSSIPSAFPSYIPSEIPSESPSFQPSSHPSKIPTFFPTLTCYDNKNFLDRLQLPCSHHKKTLSCAKLGILVGYSKKDVESVIRNCPLSCGYCETFSPSDSPSLAPTEYPTEFPTLFPTTSPTYYCHDVASFVDSRGRTCDKNKQIICSKLTFLGYAKKEVEVVMNKCALSCRLCGKTDIPSDAPTTARPTLSPTYGCPDDNSYKDHNRFSCIHFQKFNCENLHVLGYTSKQISELISHCPKSCKFC